MPKGPHGEKRPADVIGNAVMVGRIATGEIEDIKTKKDRRMAELGRSGGAKGGKARAAKLNRVRRKEIAKRAAKARWKDRSAP